MSVIQDIKTDLIRKGSFCFQKAGEAIKSFGGTVHSVATKALDVIAPLNPVSQTRRFKVVPTAVEKFLGATLYEQHAPAFKQVAAGSRYHTLVNEVFGQLVQQCECGDKFEYEVRIIEDKTIGAYCLPGGKTVITTGILDKINQRVLGNQTKLKAAIAFIMGHELTHANASHYGACATFRAVTILVGFVAGSIIGQIVNEKASKEAMEKIDQDPNMFQEQKTRKKNEIAQNARVIAEVASKLFDYFASCLTFVVERAFSHGLEYEADRHSLTYLKKAGFGFEGAKITMELFRDTEEKKGKFMQFIHDLFSTHPSEDKRLAAIDKEIEVLSQ